MAIGTFIFWTSPKKEGFFQLDCQGNLTEENRVEWIEPRKTPSIRYEECTRRFQPFKMLKEKDILTGERELYVR
jgi:hypothetical protein